MREHTAAIRRLFFDVLTDDELDGLGGASDRVLQAISSTRSGRETSSKEG